jgi:hypothetical protein
MRVRTLSTQGYLRAVTLCSLFFLIGCRSVSVPTITSFEECVAAGNPILESDPERCRTADGRTFTRDIGNALKMQDRIRVTAPQPGDTIGNTVTVEGEARGMWYFEASFPIEVRDVSDTVIGQGIAQAQGEWMTTDFVPFAASITIDAGQTGHGFLILRKDNPSGLPEHDAELRVPIVLPSSL